MKSELFIKVGDYVSVEFSNAQFTLTKKAEVLAMPCGIGDSWIFRCCIYETIYHVSEGCTISKLKDQNS